VKNLEYWKIVALVGIIVFLTSVFLPLISAFGTSDSLANVYQDIGSTDWAFLFANYPAATIGLLLLLILWPIALILSIVSIFKRKTSLIAGIVGIICWVGSVMYVSQSPLSGAVQYGAGVFAGFAGAIIVLVAYYIKPKSVTPQGSPPQVAPPPPPQQ
jgi:hypothetical protein